VYKTHPKFETVAKLITSFCLTAFLSKLPANSSKIQLLSAGQQAHFEHIVGSRLVELILERAEEQEDEEYSSAPVLEDSDIDALEVYKDQAENLEDE
jgi:hypothetical protein